MANDSAKASNGRLAYGPQDPAKHTHAHAIPPDPMSEACFRFFKADNDLFKIISSSVALIKYSMELTNERLATSRRWIDKELMRVLNLRTTTKDSKQTLRNIFCVRDQLWEIMWCKAVDNYLAYVAELLSLIFRTRPETLRSNETVELQFVLQYSSIEELIGGLADRKVGRLAYQGLTDLAEYLGKRLGFDLFSSEEDMRKAARVIEVRNLYVHNRGIVNKIFLSKVTDAKLSEGRKFPLTIEDTLDAKHLLEKSVPDLDVRAAAKFGIPQPIGRTTCGL